MQQQGVQVAKSARNFLMVIGFVSEDGSRSRSTTSSDFLVSTVQDPLSRVTGVGEVQVFGAQYAMRIWLDPAKLHELPADADRRARARSRRRTPRSRPASSAARRRCRARASTPPSPRRAGCRRPSSSSSILLRSSAQGGEVRLRDVARVEIGGENYGIAGRYNGQPAAGIGVKLAAGANALDTADAVQREARRAEAVLPRRRQGR